MSVLVTNAHYRNTLAAIRSLQKRKIPLIVTSNKPTAISFYSKYGKHRYLYQNPLKNSEAFIKSLLAILKKTKPAVLFPVGVDTTVPISFHKSKFLPLVKIPIADYDVLEKAHDKSKTVKIADIYMWEIFKLHVNQNKNDIASWVSKNISLQEGAKFKLIIDKKGMIEALGKIGKPAATKKPKENASQKINAEDKKEGEAQEKK